MSGDRSNDLFLGLVGSLQASAWMLMGKVIHPMTGKIERDLDQVKETIDLLGVLEEKTRGNLHPDESRMLGQVLFELRMNYVEELKSSAAAAAAAKSAETKDPEAPGGQQTPTAKEDSPETAIPPAPETGASQGTGSEGPPPA